MRTSTSLSVHLLPPPPPPSPSSPHPPSHRSLLLTSLLPSINYSLRFTPAPDHNYYHNPTNNSNSPPPPQVILDFLSNDDPSIEWERAVPVVFPGSGNGGNGPAATGTGNSGGGGGGRELGPGSGSGGGGINDYSSGGGPGGGRQPSIVSGCLGMIQLGPQGDLFVVLVTNSNTLGTGPNNNNQSWNYGGGGGGDNNVSSGNQGGGGVGAGGGTIEKVLGVEFICLTSSRWDPPGFWFNPSFSSSSSSLQGGSGNGNGFGNSGGGWGGMPGLSVTSPPPLASGAGSMDSYSSSFGGTTSSAWGNNNRSNTTTSDDWSSSSSASLNDFESGSAPFPPPPQHPNSSQQQQQQQYSPGGGAVGEHPATSIKKILTNGSFYFSSDFDLSTRLEARVLRNSSNPQPPPPRANSSSSPTTTRSNTGPPLPPRQPSSSSPSSRPTLPPATGSGSGSYDSRFLWNNFLIEGLLKFRDGLVEEEEEENQNQRMGENEIESTRRQKGENIDGFVTIEEGEDGWRVLESKKRKKGKGRRARFDEGGFLVLVIQGFCSVIDLPPTPTSPPTTLSLISRLSPHRAGTRYNTRGIDDDGNVANFAETEYIFRTFGDDELCFSFVQVRGSIPVFWEQGAPTVGGVFGGVIGNIGGPSVGGGSIGGGGSGGGGGGTGVGAPKVHVTRPLVASRGAFERHMEALRSVYGGVHLLNLVGDARDGEGILKRSYEEHFRDWEEREGGISSERAGGWEDVGSLSNSNGGGGGFGGGVGGGRGRGGKRKRGPGAMDSPEEVSMTNFDFHARSKGGGGIESVKDQLLTMEQGVMDDCEGFGYCLVSRNLGGSNNTGEEVVLRQRGAFRTNCLDCLDRTNVVQDILSHQALEHFLLNYNPALAHSDQLWSIHRTLWAENGDALSRIYAGTGALNTSFTRSGKRTLGGFLSDATKSVSRMYVSNFVDRGKQMAIDALLGNLPHQQKVLVFDPHHDYIKDALSERISEYSTPRTITIWVGTFNLNGRPPPSESLLPWLFPEGTSVEPDLMVVAFQEIVQLSPQQIMATDPEYKKRWERYIIQTLAQRPDKKSDYVILRSEQLVGTALLILVKTTVAHQIRSVEATTKKTGFKGMAGNKGAVAFRLEFSDTTFCFVTAHFAAGHSAYEERNRDFWTIMGGTQFLRGKDIAGHDNIIWLGDFNYRISLPNEEVRALAQTDQYDALLEADQLQTAMRERNVFGGYTEAPIAFRPTYKYDNGTDQYDTSEKARIPAYTDRILYRGRDLDMNRYSRAEIYSSDHRPVYGILRATVRVIDKSKKAAIQASLKTRHAMSLAKESQQQQQQQGQNKGVVNGVGKEDVNLMDFPLPSDDNQAWWNGPDHPDGIFIPSPSLINSRSNGDQSITNPFDEDFFSSKKTTISNIPSDSLSISSSPMRKTSSAPPPPPPTIPDRPRKSWNGPQQSSPTTTTTTMQHGKRAPPAPPPRSSKPTTSGSGDFGGLAPPTNLRRSSSNSSLLDELNDDEADASGKGVGGSGGGDPLGVAGGGLGGTKVKGGRAGGWQVIEPERKK